MKFTESPRWHDCKPWFLDIHDQRIKTAHLGGQLETAVESPFIPNAFGFPRDGGLQFGDALQRQIYRWDSKTLQLLPHLSGMTTFCLSDGIVDAQGRMYVGDIGYNLLDRAGHGGLCGDAARAGMPATSDWTLDGEGNHFAPVPGFIIIGAPAIPFRSSALWRSRASAA